MEVEVWNPVKASPQQKIYKPLAPLTLTDGDILKIQSIDEDTCVLLCETKQSNQRHKEIKAHIQTITAETLSNPPQVGQLVLSPCEGEPGLYRGVIKAIQNNTAEIYFLDYGNSETVPIKQLRNVDDKLATYEPVLLSSPKFWYLEGRKLSVDSYSFLEENVSRKYIVVIRKLHKTMLFHFFVFRLLTVLQSSI